MDSETVRRPGRPALAEGEDSTPLSVRLTVSDYEALCSAATRCRASVPHLVRIAVRRLLEDERGGAIVVAGTD